MTNNRISVVMAVYNGAAYLAEAIESILAQTLQPLEIILMDDGSTDGSAEIAKQFEPLLHYYYQPNSGLATAQNNAITHAKGELLTFLDADDLWEENKLTLQVEALNNKPQLDAVFGYVKQFISPDVSAAFAAKLNCPVEPNQGFCAGAMLIKRKAFAKVGNFSTKFTKGLFIDWYMRAMEVKLNVLLLPNIVMRRRLHYNNMGITKSMSNIDYVRLLKTGLDRRRQKSHKDVTTE